MKDNKLIAEFMGVYSEEKGYDYSKIGNKGVYYHTSWDWLMPVVKRIVRDVELDVGYEDEYREHLMDVIPFVKIEDVYEAVVAFIKNQKR
tara:strand:- start:605 stop:874 length:270 start_codon:yes stop_codon:yes gene_type:complete